MIDQHNRRNWQKSIGYVPQHIYLADDTLTANIAFGQDEEKIDFAAVQIAAKRAFLHDFVISEMPLGYKTRVGERGVRLSGGQIFYSDYYVILGALTCDFSNGKTNKLLINNDIKQNQRNERFLYPISLQNDSVLTSIPSGAIFLIDNEFILNIPDTSPKPKIKWVNDETNDLTAIC